MADFNAQAAALTAAERRQFAQSVLQAFCGADYCGQIPTCMSCPRRRQQLLDLAEWAGN